MKVAHVGHDQLLVLADLWVHQGSQNSRWGSVHNEQGGVDLIGGVRVGDSLHPCHDRWDVPGRKDKGGEPIKPVCDLPSVHVAQSFGQVIETKLAVALTRRGVAVDKDGDGDRVDPILVGQIEAKGLKSAGDSRVIEIFEIHVTNPIVLTQS